MDINRLNSAVLKQIAAKLEKRESLMSQIEAIDREIAALQSDKKNAPSKAKAKPLTAGSKAPRGMLKDCIISELKASGDKGITVEALAKKLNRDPKNLHSWFNITGKKIKNIKRIGRGLFHWEN
jgi:hypothetical protein